MTSEEDKTKTNLAIENLKSQLNESYRCAEKLMSLRNTDLDKLNTVFDKIGQEQRPSRVICKNYNPLKLTASYE